MSYSVFYGETKSVADSYVQAHETLIEEKPRTLR